MGSDTSCSRRRTLSAAAVKWDFTAEPGPPVSVFQWDLVNGKLLADRKDIGWSSRIPRLTLNGESVLAQTTGLTLLDAVTGKQKLKFQADLSIFPLPCGTTPADIPCTFSPDGRQIAVPGMIAAGTDTIQALQNAMAIRTYYGIFDLTTGKETQRIPQEGNSLNLCAFSADSKHFAAAEGSRLRIWASATGKRVWESALLRPSNIRPRLQPQRQSPSNGLAGFDDSDLGSRLDEIGLSGSWRGRRGGSRPASRDGLPLTKATSQYFTPRRDESGRMGQTRS